LEGCRLVYVAKVLIQSEIQAEKPRFESWHFPLSDVAEKGDLMFLCRSMDETNYGKKGSCFLQFLVFLILFVILLIWVYNKNFHMTF